MGKLIDGAWVTDDRLQAAEAAQYKKAAGKFERGTAGFRNWVTADGKAGPSGMGGFKAEAGRYHLFAALNCPWAHRTLIYRNVKGLADVIGLSLAAPKRTDQGWVFVNDKRNEHYDDGRFAEGLFGIDNVHELYTRSKPDYSGRVTVPVLWDTQTQQIVSNESSEIIRMFNSAFNDITGDDQDFCPEAVAAEIDEMNDFIFNNINNGVYKTGFARTQEAYDAGVKPLFAALDDVEQRLAHSRYLLGDHITEADWRLLPTLVRFDVAYYSAFKCNVKAIRDYPNLSRYLNDLYGQPGIAQTVDLDIYRGGYHSISPMRNPHGIVPVGFATPFYELGAEYESANAQRSIGDAVA